MACPSYEAVESFAIDIENDVQPPYFIRLHFAQQIVNHLTNNLSYQFFIAFLRQSNHVLFHPRWLILHVLILRGSQEGDFREMIELLLRGQFVQIGLFEVEVVFHCELQHRFALLDSVHQP